MTIFPADLQFQRGILAVPIAIAFPYLLEHGRQTNDAAISNMNSLEFFQDRKDRCSDAMNFFLHCQLLPRFHELRRSFIQALFHPLGAHRHPQTAGRLTQFTITGCPLGLKRHHQCLHKSAASDSHLSLNETSLPGQDLDLLTQYPLNALSDLGYSRHGDPPVMLGLNTPIMPENPLFVSLR